MKRMFDIDLIRCTGCGACVIACMDQNDVDLKNGDNVLRSLQSFQTSMGRCHISLACMHCADAPCIASCPAGCIKRDPESGLVLCDNEACIGCRSCAESCPIGAPKFTASGKMVKCDGCAERVKQGMEPACVQICYMKALRLYTEEEHAQAKLGCALTEVLKTGKHPYWK